MPAPTGSALETLLTSLGITVTLATPTDAYISAALAEFYRLTGRHKLEADANDSSIRIRPPRLAGDRLILDIPDFRTITTVQVGWNGTSGTTLVYWDEVEYLPDNNTIYDRPIEALVFASYPAEDVYVTGKQGYAQTFPTDAFRAIVARAAALILPTFENAPGTIKSEKIGDRDIEYGSGMDSVISRFNDEFAGAVRRYRKPRHGVM